MLEFSDYISNYGTLKFRVNTQDPIAAQGLFAPYQYHVKLYKDNVVAWAGVIIGNPKRNHKFIEVEAATYTYLLSKVQVAHTATTPFWREFVSGMMSTAVTTLFNEGKARTSSPISSFTLSATNPSYPWETATPWTFTEIYSVKFEFVDLLRALSVFADITNADFTVDRNKNLTFTPVLGTERKDVSLVFGKGGNIEDYDSPLDGMSMTNDFVAASWDKSGANIIKSEKSDSSTYPIQGRLWSSVLIAEKLEQKQLDEKAKRMLNLNNQLDTEVSLILGPSALPFGVYSLGDYIHVAIKDGPINVNQMRRVLGWKVFVNSNGVDNVELITNTRI